MRQIFWEETEDWFFSKTLGSICRIWISIKERVLKLLLKIYSKQEISLNQDRPLNKLEFK